MKTFSRLPSERVRSRISCNLCGCSHTELLWDFGDWVFERCGSCGLVFQNPQPDAEELSRRYDNEYFDYEIENADSFFRLMKLGLDDVGFDDVEKELMQGSPGRKPFFLDVGCATGRLVEHAASRGWRAAGVEICAEAAGYGRRERGVEIFTGTLEGAAIEPGSVDFIHSSHFVEHLTDPGAYFAEAGRILRPGGFLVTVTPDISGFQAKLFGREWRSVIADHMFLFSGKTLRSMLEKKRLQHRQNCQLGRSCGRNRPFTGKKGRRQACKGFRVGGCCLHSEYEA